MEPKIAKKYNHHFFHLLEFFWHLHMFLKFSNASKNASKPTLTILKWLYYFMLSNSASHPADLSFWNSPKASIEMQVFSTSQQLINGIKLWAVSHVLVHVQYVGQNTGNG